MVERERIETGEYEDDDDDDDFDEHAFDDDEDFYDDEEENVESLAQKASIYAPNADTLDDDEDDDEAWDVEEFLQEDIAFMTPLDPLDAYLRFQQTMQYLSSTGQGTILEQRLLADQRTLVQSLLEKADKKNVE
jgi:hypothetical protein